MLGLARELNHWFETGRDFAVATVVAVRGSTPRDPGAALAVDDTGTVVGSISGGCVEATVYELCRQALTDGHTVSARFGPTGDDLFATGLTCGGVIDVLVTPVRAAAPGPLRTAVAAVRAGEPVALALVVDGPADTTGHTLVAGADGAFETTLPGPDRDIHAVAARARAALAAARTERVTTGDATRGRLTLLIESSAPPPRLIVFGAIEVAAALARLGKFLGYHVTVCDARPVFATPARFPDADEVVADRPHRYLETAAVDDRTVLCVLTHDPEFDIPLLTRALRLPVAYVGVMGSRRTQTERIDRLRAAGITAAELTRLRAPTGLDLGGRTPEETALAIAAEFVAERHGGTGLPLASTHTRIHHDAPPQFTDVALAGTGHPDEADRRPGGERGADRCPARS
ncbi:XdhC family protein [Nocardia sp. NPDC003345]